MASAGISSDENPLLLLFSQDSPTTEVQGTSNLEEDEDRRKSSECEVNINKENVCDVCKGTFTLKGFKDHKKTERHRLARKNIKKIRKSRGESPPVQVATICRQATIRAVGKERYNIRFDIELTEQNQRYQNTLTTFLALRFCLNKDNIDLKFSMNNLKWKEFGDIVIEICYAKSCKVYAIQCKKIQGGNDITIEDLRAERARFSLKQQCDILEELRSLENYDNTYFKLFTVSNLSIDNDVQFTYGDDVIEKWHRDSKDKWRGREVQVSLYNKKCLVNTTDDPDNICLFKMLNDETVDKDLGKFRLYVNQRNTESLKYLVRSIIEDKFDIKRDISSDMVKYVSEFFQKNKVRKYNYKMTKKDFLLKVAELILVPFILLPASAVEGKLISLWENTLAKFDLSVIKNNSDTLNKIYKSLNYLLKTKISSKMDTSLKSWKIDKQDVQDEIIESEMFEGFVGTFREVSLTYLYITLWKTEFAPLVLKVDNEADLLLIIKIINFLKTEDISVKFILMTDIHIHSSYFPENLKIFNTLEDLEDETFLSIILDLIQIPVFDFNVCLKEIIEFNPDFLTKVTPDVLLNMCLGEFCFKNTVVPMTADIIDNTVVFNDEIMKKLKKYCQKRDHFTYIVNVKGNLCSMEIPPDI